ncbi:helix-turn-helix domain-containing protein [Winogradskyella forsetii]|uniref:helix-turn-helix domain-containing protein n=1 Tax=Winogradskyella forsetii TaxID=2686077 RepID=UPI0015B9F84F|nr:AraC family transcriptional regulator [Winogradskyella forsetii]
MSQLLISNLTPNSIRLDQICSLQKQSCISDYEINRKIGKGIIRYFKLDNGFKVFEIDAILKDTFQLNLFNENKNFIYFIYCTEGNIDHKFNRLNKLTNINELCLSIVGSEEGDSNCLLLKPNKTIKLSIVCIDQHLFFQEYYSETPLQKQLISKTDEISAALSKLKDHIYSCFENLTISQQLRSINAMAIENDFLDLLRVKSKYQLILSAYFTQFYEELYLERRSSKLSTYELQQTRLASEFISDNLENQHSIKTLCEAFGLSPAKLQLGFKFMHQTTVSDFIRNKRLDRAEELFMTTDLNVSEVVYKIGMTSRSYFCKIFKLKFGVSPSCYKQNTIVKSNQIKSAY